MATRYFANSVDQNWDTLGNWWSDAAFTEGFSGTLTGVTVTDTDETVTCDSTAGLVVGRPITGTGIDTGTTVASITNSTDFELSLPAIANGSSNLTCELHVIPVTGDDVVIATGNGTVAGTPSADVLGLVTVNGDSNLNVTLAAANFEFNDTSYIDGDITGNVTFNDSSHNRGGTGGVGFPSYTGGITGDCTFNDSSYNGSGYNDIGGGTINGNATFHDASFNQYNGGINGNATFTNAEYSNDPQQGFVSGTVTFNSLTSVKFTLTGAWYSDTTGWVFDTAGQNWEFNDTGYNASGGNITGNATFTNTAFSTALTGFFNPQQGTVSGTVDFPNGATFTLESGESWTADATYWTGTLAWVLNGTSYIDGDITGNCTFNDSSYNIGGSGYGYGITGDCTFNDYSTNGLYNVASGYITGDCWFYGSSFNEYNGNITGNATFPEAEYSSALQGGNYGGNGPQQGTVTGTVTFTSLTPVKFTLAGTEMWQVNTTGWVFDTAGQNWEFNDESCNGTYGTVNGACVFNGGPSYPIPYQNQGTVNGNCVFNVYYGLDTTAVVNGDCVFNSTKVAGTITGNCTFNGYSWCDSNLAIIGNCTLNETAYLDGTITGNCEFNGDSSNYADITGNATVRQHAAAFTAWRDYATSTYVTGTLTLQFPEMDVLGTGLL